MRKGRDETLLSILQLLGSLRSSGPALREHITLMLELARIEWQQERRRFLGLIVAGVMLLFCCMSLMAFSAAVILALLWDTPYRVLAIGIILLLFASGGLAAWFKLRQLIQLGAKSFGATRKELARDLFQLRHKIP